MKKIELNTWHRQQHFEFFKEFNQPFFNVCATVDVTKTYEFCQQNQRSFFICSLFLLGYTANQIKPFRYRIIKDEVILFDECEISCTVLNPDKSFSFVDFASCQAFDKFYSHAQHQLEQSKQAPYKLMTEQNKPNSIFCSVLPWLHFTSFSHAQQQANADSTPRLVMGKFKKVADEMAMPVSVDVHHALVDGVDVGEYFAKLQENFKHFFKNS